jgi:hypothetical protein
LKRYSVVILLTLIWVGIWSVKTVKAQGGVLPVEDTTSKIVLIFHYNFSDDSNLLIDSTRFHSPLMMETPDLLKEEIEYDPDNNRYILRSKIGKRL